MTRAVLGSVIVSSLISINASISFAGMIATVSGVEGSDTTRVNAIRSTLTEQLPAQTRSLVATQIAQIPTIPSNLTIPSSYFFKSLVETSTRMVLTTQKYGALPSLDPSMTEKDVQRRRAAIEDRACIDGFAKARQNGSMDLDQVITQLVAQIIPESEKTARSARKLSTQEIQFANSMNLVLAQVLTAPQSKSWGTIHDVERIGSGVRTLRISKAKDRSSSSDVLPYTDRLALSLSMLVSFRTGQDAAFIRVQNCLYDFWSEQEQVFGRHVLNGDNKPRSADVDKFLLGRKFANSSDELNYIKDQLFRISKARPFMKSRLQGAIEANRLLSMLSTKQLDQLIDLFLTLSADELPNAEQMRALGDKARSTSLLPIDSALIHFQQFDRDLTELALTLDEEKSLKQGAIRDIEGLKKMR